MSVGPAEILVIMIVALLVFGPQRLPEVGRQVGAAMRELRKMQDTVRGELDMVLHPEHGTRAPDAPSEPGDHTTSRGELTSGDVDRRRSIDPPTGTERPVPGLGRRATPPTTARPTGRPRMSSIASSVHPTRSSDPYTR